jgi:hypothetical protein
MKWVVTFGRFWYDFIVGDSVALAIGGISVVAIGALLVWLGFATGAEVLMPFLVVGTLVFSLQWPRGSSGH